MTPPEVIEAARKALGGTIDLDPASSAFANTFVKAREFFTEGAIEKRWWTDVHPGADCAEARGASRVFLNPPGGVDDNRQSNAVRFWRKLVYEWQVGRVREAVFVAFSLELFQSAQTPPKVGMSEERPHESMLRPPTFFPFCVPRKRLQFRVETWPCVCGHVETNHVDANVMGSLGRCLEKSCAKTRACGRFERVKEPVARIGASPTHANAIVYLPSNLTVPTPPESFVRRFCEAFEEIGSVVVPHHWGY